MVTPSENAEHPIAVAEPVNSSKPEDDANDDATLGSSAVAASTDLPIDARFHSSSADSSTPLAGRKLILPHHSLIHNVNQCLQQHHQQFNYPGTKKLLFQALLSISASTSLQNTTTFVETHLPLLLDMASTPSLLFAMLQCLITQLNAGLPFHNLLLITTPNAKECLHGWDVMMEVVYNIHTILLRDRGGLIRSGCGVGGSEALWMIVHVVEKFVKSCIGETPDGAEHAEDSLGHQSLHDTNHLLNATLSISFCILQQTPGIFVYLLTTVIPTILQNLHRHYPRQSVCIPARLFAAAQTPIQAGVVTPFKLLAADLPALVAGIAEVGGPTLDGMDAADIAAWVFQSIGSMEETDAGLFLGEGCSIILSILRQRKGDLMTDSERLDDGSTKSASMSFANRFKNIFTAFRDHFIPKGMTCQLFTLKSDVTFLFECASADGETGQGVAAFCRHLILFGKKGDFKNVGSVYFHLIAEVLEHDVGTK
ncbi:hypothetical protein HDV00_005244 [Rhizophlyctis rosea]|nr:hypothetical protein HDV00_005244 [Rhizophlyctis rosea]